MKKSDIFYERVDPARVALLFGIALGLGIAVHEVFFFVAGAIGVGALAAVLTNVIRDHPELPNRLARHRR